MRLCDNRLLLVETGESIFVSNMLKVRFIYRIRVLLTILMFVTCSCSITPDDISSRNTIDEIIALADRARDRGAYKVAGVFYMEVDRLYPYSNRSREALIKAIKTYHAGTELLESRLAAKRYLSLYPGGPDAAFAQYIIGLSFFDAIVDVKRDQGAALSAVKEFQNLGSNFPSSLYTKLAEKKLLIAYAQLAGQEMSVGRYYLEREEYLAAINRFNVVIDKYSETIFCVEAFYRLTEAYIALGMADLAKGNNKLILARYPNSKWAKLSDALIRNLEL